MTAIEIQKEEYEEALKKGIIPKVFLAASRTVGEEIPKNISMNIAVNEIIALAGALRVSAHAPTVTSADGETITGRDVIPSNISVAFLASGGGKDSSREIIRSSFKLAYERVEESRQRIAKHNAVEEYFVQNGTQKLKRNQVMDFGYLKYLVEPEPVVLGKATPSGLARTAFEHLKVGLGSIYTASGELASNLTTDRINYLPFMCSLAEMFDNGILATTALSDKDNQKGAVEGMPTNCMLMSSYSAFITDGALKKTFTAEMIARLARRCNLTFASIKIRSNVEYDSKEDMIKALEIEHIAMYTNRNAINKKSEQVAKYWIGESKNKHVELSSEFMTNHYKLILKHTKELADNIPEDQYPMYALNMQDLAWRTLKLAVAMTVWKMEDSVTYETYCDCLVLLESFTNDVKAFEDELRKETFEVFSDMMRKNAQKNGGSFAIRWHQLLKKELIKKTGKTENNINELISNAISFDPTITYAVNVGTKEVIARVAIKKIAKIEAKDKCEFKASYKKIKFPHAIETANKDLSDTMKESASKSVQSGLSEVCSGEFSKLKALVAPQSTSLMFTNYHFDKQEFGRKHISDKSLKWVILDIDNGSLGIEDMHEALAEYNHILALTSKPTVKTKYRLLIELDKEIDMPLELYVYFIAEIGKLFGLVPDRLGAAHKYFGFQGREALMVTDKKCVPTKQLLIRANVAMADARTDLKMSKKEKHVALGGWETKEEKKQRIKTFEKYHHPSNHGGRSNALNNGLYHAANLGADIKFLTKLATFLNNMFAVGGHGKLNEEEMERISLGMNAIISNANR